MSNFVDIHHHLVYGVDDGARTFEDMQQMILQAVNQQVSDIVCTSHATPRGRSFPMELYLWHLQRAQLWIAQEGLPVRLYPGCEVLYSDHSARQIREGMFPTLAGTSAVLVEFTPDTDFDRMCDAARQIGNLGYSVIFAHVERYQALRNLKHVNTLREDYGVYMQMNTNTVITKKGFFFDRWVRHMLDEGYVDCVASDAHNVTSRVCRMRLCYEMLKERYGREAALDMCGGFQRRLLGLPWPEEY